jgi:hypothetical protein
LVSRPLRFKIILYSLFQIIHNEEPCGKPQGIKHQKIAVIPRLDRGIQNKRTGFSGQARERHKKPCGKPQGIIKLKINYLTGYRPENIPAEQI